MRELRQLFVPHGLVFVAALAAAEVGPLRSAVLPAAPTVLLVALAVGALLSLRFHRGRPLLLFLIVAAVYGVLRLTAATAAPEARVAFDLTAALLPVDFMIVALLGERGTLSRAGRIRLGVLAAQALFVAAVAWDGGAAVARVLEAPLPWLSGLDTALPQRPLLLFVLALVVLVAAAEPVFAWALVAVLLALLPEPAVGVSTIWLAAAGVMLTVAVVESSYALAYRDGLTGLPSRRAFNEALQHTGGRFSVAMVDVDHFKQCNDRWGHDVGDQVLRMVATKLEVVGGGARAFRYGGEEFAVLFPGLGADQALEQCEALRASVAAASFAVRHRPRPRRHGERKRGTRKKGEEIAVTVSIGLAEGGAGSPDDAVRAADRALYRAKEGGRNRVET